jgi:hypothetical protein
MAGLFKHALGLSVASCVACLASTSMAAVIYAGSGSLSPSGSDLSGLTGTLEDGARANLLGAFGSAIAYAGNGTFIATPDRGSNATNYNPAIDNTTTYINRFHDITLGMTLQANGTVTVTPTLTKTTLLTKADGVTYFDGRSDHFDRRFDPEGVRVAPDGKSVFISDEYGPYIRQFDRATGKLIRDIAVPAKFLINTPQSTGAAELPPTNTSGRQANRGMEGLAITPDGKTLVGIMQSPLIQDGGLNAANARVGTNVRILSVDIATGATKEFLYQLSNASNGISEILAVNNNEFLVIERDGRNGANAQVKNIVKIDITGATDISNIAALPSTGTPAGVTAVSKSIFINMLATEYGLAGSAFPEKIEGIAFGQDLLDVSGNILHTLVVTNDNDFLGTVLNNFFVFTFRQSDLPGFVAQNVPEPATLVLAGAGFAGAGFAARRRKRG